MIIRPAQISDIDQIVDNNLLLASEQQDLHLSKQQAYIGSEQVLKDDSKGFYLVAEHEHMIIGQLFITTEWSDWRNNVIWWIHRVYIQKPWRRKGIFTALFTELKRMARDQHIFAIRLYMLEHNHTAYGIYQKRGLYDTPFIILEQGPFNDDDL